LSHFEDAMPFAVIRRYQKKLLPIFAILAMIAFVLSDFLMKSFNRGPGANADPEIVSISGKPVKRSDLEPILNSRSVANKFMFYATGGQDPIPFGGYSYRELVDGYILQKEADRLGIPDSPDFAKEWLKKMSNGKMTRQLFDSLIRQLGGDVSGQQALTALSAQLRLSQARQLLGSPLVSPLDIYDAYREQNERSVFRAVSFPAENFLDKVGEPTSTDVQALYDQFKGTLPDPDRDTPGFKIPREVRLEVISIDGAAVAKGIQAKLTEAELKTYYEGRKEDFKIESELPLDIFKDDEKAALTPTRYRSFADVKEALAPALAREKAQEEISDKLAAFREKQMDDFSDRYNDAVSENADAKKNNEPESAKIPAYASLAEAAKAAGLEHETTPRLSQRQAQTYGALGSAQAGLNPLNPGEARFSDAVFAPKSPLYDGLEFSEPNGRRYLVRKIEDSEPHVASLEEVRAEVVAAWKLGKARELAKKAAEDLAATLKKDGGKIKDQIVGGRPVIVTDAVSPLTMGMPIPGRGLQFAPATKTELFQFPKASEALRDAIFSLKPGGVAVEADTPKKNYYVVTLDRRDPATFTGLYGISGVPMIYQMDAFRKALEDDETDRMTSLRTKAGIPANWVPLDEKDRAEAQAKKG
jgi:peptidyl-prolyl cis-trans isomerase D